MKNDVYIYPAIFTYADDGISIDFPDLAGCISCGSDDYDAVKNAKEALALYMTDLENEKKRIPKPTPVSKIKLENNQHVFPIEVWMPYHRALVETTMVKKTLTIPSWLNVMGEHHKINFSQLLTKALREELSLIAERKETLLTPFKGVVKGDSLPKRSTISTINGEHRKVRIARFPTNMVAEKEPKR